ncbi:SRPBCC family protein [Devosia chinhatensis]|uniref:ATPase n=1 Tax=Devosia chinhatensis TaxID=429727 RepID=A0A0F5FEP7_9HYPH|nr:SRPBCC family protein [Devosia chinhatensis]KKB07273.1 ATPase [Devosia chinhatensis]
MAYEFTISGRISKPVHDVFEAVADPAKLSGYFTTGGAQGRLETGAVVQWDFHDFPGAFPVHVTEVVQDERIVLKWEAPEDGDAAGTYDTTVTMTFEAIAPDRTLVKIHEAGWRENAAGQKASYGNCEGWTGMLAAMKVYLEHGINLRQDFYK